MVKSLFLKTKHMVLCFAAISSLVANASQWKFSEDRDYAEIAEISRIRNSSCDKLCIGKILTKCLKTKQLKAEKIESETLKTDSLCANSVSSDAICARTINASERICVPAFSSPSVCAEQLNANNACVSGLLRANNFEQCGLYRATVGFSQDTVYNLGDLVPFDVILDDPNNNTTTAPFTYTAPVSGYYILTIQIDQYNIQGANAIVGIPIANLTVFCNGSPSRDTYSPYLSFHNEQKITTTSLISLQAGDVIDVRYNVFVMEDGSGFIPYVGTVVIQGNGSENNAAMLKIHYLSSDCAELPCIPCQATPCASVCDIPCVSVDCCVTECCDEN